MCREHYVLLTNPVSGLAGVHDTFYAHAHLFSSRPQRLIFSTHLILIHSYCVNKNRPHQIEDTLSSPNRFVSQAVSMGTYNEDMNAVIEGVVDETQETLITTEEFYERNVEYTQEYVDLIDTNVEFINDGAPHSKQAKTPIEIEQTDDEFWSHVSLHVEDLVKEQAAPREGAYIEEFIDLNEGAYIQGVGDEFVDDELDPNEDLGEGDDETFHFSDDDQDYDSPNKWPVIDNEGDSCIGDEESEGDGDLSGHMTDEEDFVGESDEEEIAILERDMHITFKPYKDQFNGSILFNVGDVFPSVKSLREKLVDYSIQEGFQMKYLKNDRRRVTVRCDRCKWELHAYAYPRRNDVDFAVKRIIQASHTCVRRDRNKWATSKWVARKVGPVLVKNPNWQPADVKKWAKDNYNLKMSYMKAYRAWQIAIGGTKGGHEEGYTKLRQYAMKVVETNPGSVAKVLVDPPGPLAVNPNFQRFFLCFHGVKEGFLNGCRPFIGVDGCFLKGPYGGQLLTAVALDGDSCLFPLAFAIVETENKDSWSWFMHFLKQAIGEKHPKNAPWTIMSDRQKGLDASIFPKFPTALHRKCSRHIYNNFRNAGHRGQVLRTLFWKASKAYSHRDHQHYMNEINQINFDAHKYLHDINPAQWCRYEFDTTCKSEHVTNNMTESFNAWLADLRSRPVMQMMETIRVKVMKRIVKRKAKGEAMGEVLTEYAVKKLNMNINKSRDSHPSRSSDTLFNVFCFTEFLTVDLVKSTCTCGEWQLTGIPCPHACICITYLRVNIEPYVDLFFSKDNYIKTYSHPLYPIDDHTYWEPPTNQCKPIKPPIILRAPGRPATKRKRGEEEGPSKSKKKGEYMCSNCHKRGHNKKTCKGAEVGGNDALRGKKKHPRRRSMKTNKITGTSGMASNASTA